MTSPKSLIWGVLFSIFFPQISGFAQGASVDGTLMYSGTPQPAAMQRVLLCEVTTNANGDVRLTQSLKFVVTTDAQGRFGFLAVPIGTYAIVSGLNELRDLNGNSPIRITVKTDGERISLGRVNVGKGADVEGVLVEEATSKPAAKIQLMICPIIETSEGQTSFRINLSLVAETDEKGRFQIKGIPAGTYGLLALPSFVNEFGGTPQVGYAKDKEPFYRVDSKKPVRININDGTEKINLGTIAAK